MVDLSSNTVTTNTGWLVLQRLQRHDGRQFITPAIFDTKQNADIFASCFDNVVEIMPIVVHVAPSRRYVHIKAFGTLPA